MDILRRGGKDKNLPILFYVFIILICINVFGFIYLYSGVLERSDLLQLLLVCAFISILIEWLIFLISWIYYLITKKTVYRFTTMIIMHLLILSSFIFVFYYTSRDWSDKKKNDFLCDCYQKGIVGQFDIELMNFNKIDLQNIQLRIKSNGIVVDSVFVDINTEQDNPLHSYFIINPLEIYKEYEFCINKQKYVLSNFKINLKPQFSMITKNYSCSVKEFELNGKNIKDKFLLIVNDKK